MRILAITNRYPRYGHPTDAPYNRLQFAALAREHELAVIAPVAWPERLKGWGSITSPRKCDSPDGFQIYYPTYYFPPRLFQRTYGRFFLSSIQRTTERVIREFRPDAILACWAHPDGWAAVRIARQAGLPVIIKVIGSDVLVITKNLRRRERVAEALREADGVIAVSRDLAEHVVRLGVDPKRAHVVYEGVDLDLFRPGDRGESRARLGLPPTGTILLFVGNVLFSKGAGVLLEACARLRDRGVDFHCYLVGRGGDTGAIHTLTARLKLNERVTLTGPRPQGSLPDWYRAADLVVLPSFSEGVPNVLREALACGRPFVATRVGGIPEIAREPAGRLVPPGDPAALAGAIEETLATLPTAEEVRLAAVNISWEESARQLAELLRNTVSRKQSEGRSRLLILTNRYPRLTTPTDAPYNRLQFEQLSRTQELLVICPVPWLDKLRELFYGDRLPTKYRCREGIWVYEPTNYFPPGFFRYLYGRFLLWSVRRTTERVIREFRPDAILACWAHPDGWAAVRIARQAGLPVIIKVHGSDVLVITKNPRRRERVAEALREADGVIAVSRDLAEHVVRLGVDPNRVHVISHGVDLDLFRPGDRGESRARLGLPPTGTILLFVGNVLFSKGAGVLLEACARLRDRGVDFHCYLVGRGGDTGAIHTLTARLKLNERVTLTGPRPQGSLPDWYRAADLVVLPSFSEGVPNVLREALACGRPFVATRVGGIPEIAREPAGRLVPPGDPAALAGAIEETLATLPTAEEVRLAAVNISWEESARQLAELLRNTVSRRLPN